MRLKIVVLILGILFLVNCANAQQLDSIPKHSPKKATLLSLIPGGGQVYNKKYWKVPIIYGGFAALTYSLIFNQNEYDRFRNAYKQSINNQPITDDELANVPTDMILNLREAYRKSRDFSAVAIVGLYVLNLVDAAVDAHLKDFNVSENLSIKIKPVYNYQNGLAYSGLNLKINLH